MRPFDRRLPLAIPMNERLLVAIVNPKAAVPVSVKSNDNSRGGEGFACKLAWMDRIADYAQTLFDDDRPFVITGDFNVCPTDEDHTPGTLSPTDALVRPRVAPIDEAVGEAAHQPEAPIDLSQQQCARVRGDVPAIKAGQH
jgi:hypothetical protein